MLNELTAARRAGDQTEVCRLMGEISYLFRHVKDINAQIVKAERAGVVRCFECLSDPMHPGLCVGG